MHCNAHASRRRATGILLLALLFSAAQPPPASSARAQGNKALCKKILHAVRAGEPLEQIMADFQVDAQQVMACTQTKGKRRKPKSPKPATSKRAVSPAVRQSNMRGYSSQSNAR